MNANVGAPIESNDAIAKMIAPAEQERLKRCNVSFVICPVLHDLGADAVEVAGQNV
jgi:hypothetical protein